LTMFQVKLATKNSPVGNKGVLLLDLLGMFIIYGTPIYQAV
jgi:hypothetical protein